jgi:hypothetical protein
MRHVADRLLDAPSTRALLGIVATGAFAMPLVASGALTVRVTPGRSDPLDLLLLEAAKRLCLSEPPTLFMCPGRAPEVYYFGLPAHSLDISDTSAWQRHAAVVVSTGAVAAYTPWELQAAMATALGAHVAPGGQTGGVLEVSTGVRKYDPLERAPVATIATAASLAALAPDVLRSLLPAEARAAWSRQALQLLAEARHLVALSGDRCALVVAQDEALVATAIAKAACGTGGALADLSLGALRESAAAWKGAAGAQQRQLMREGRGDAVAVLGDTPAVLRIAELERWACSAEYLEIIGSTAAADDCDTSEIVEALKNVG